MQFGPSTIDLARSRLDPPSDLEPDTDRRAAAVLIPLFVVDDDIHVLLTKRTEHLRRHSGEISFPGGGREDGDRTLLDTALRETQEEVGLDPAVVEVLGTLEDIPTFGSNYHIRPFVGHVPFPYEFVHAPHEVERMLTPKLEVFTDPSIGRVERRERDGFVYEVNFFDVDGDIVWGATARMLVRLIEVLSAG